MNDSESAAKVQYLTALCKVQGTIGSVKKDSENPHFKNSYASLEAVNQAIMGPLNENGFVLLQGGVEIGGKPFLLTRLFHISGHSEEFVYPLIENDGNPQHMGSATTYARRYSLCALLNLSTEDDDAEAASSSVRTVSRQPAGAAAPAAASSGEARFVPSKVEFVDGKGKGAGKVFCAIYSPKGIKLEGDELQGEIADAAAKAGKEIVLSYEKKGNYFNIKRGSLKMVEPAPAADETIEEVPF
jgi:hypothetical protein